MRTPYSLENQRFSDAAHAAARGQVYPDVFGVRASAIEWVDHHVGDGGVSAVLDGQLGIDRTAKVSRGGCLGSFDTIIQERFRRMEYAVHRDITITEVNRLTGHLSEMYKLKAGIFTYGYFDNASTCFGEVVVVNVEMLVDAIVRERVRVGRKVNPRTDQTFLTVRIESLLDVPGMVRWHSFGAAARPSSVLRSRRHWSGSAHKVGQAQARLSLLD